MLVLLASDLGGGGFLQEKLTFFMEVLSRRHRVGDDLATEHTSTHLAHESQKLQEDPGMAGQWQAGPLSRSSESANK